MAVLCLVASAGAAPSEPDVQRGRYLFLWGGLPVGRVTLTLEPRAARYRYTSDHLFARSAPQVATHFERTLLLDERGQLRDRPGLVPEALWLWHPPPKGCVPGLDERSDQTGALCAATTSPAQAEGTLFGEPFVATYAHGTLSGLRLGAFSFEAVPEGTASAVGSPVDVFAGGYPVPSGAGVPRLEPPFAPLAMSPVAPRAAFARAQALGLLRSLREEAKEVDAAELATCVEMARRFVARARALGGDAQLVYGLVLQKAHAFPHAWVQVRTPEGAWLELDPALGHAVTPGDYVTLEVTSSQGSPLRAGKAYRDLLTGRARVVRGP